MYVPRPVYLLLCLCDCLLALLSVCICLSRCMHSQFSLVICPPIHLSHLRAHDLDLKENVACTNLWLVTQKEYKHVWYYFTHTYLFFSIFLWLFDIIVIVIINIIIIIFTFIIVTIIIIIGIIIFYLPPPQNIIQHVHTFRLTMAGSMFPRRQFPSLQRIVHHRYLRPNQQRNATLRGDAHPRYSGARHGVRVG